MAENPGEVITMLINEIRVRQLNHLDPRSVALVITHLEDALLRWNHANA